jgi:hypothetical protein
MKDDNTLDIQKVALRTDRKSLAYIAPEILDE